GTASLTRTCRRYPTATTAPRRRHVLAGRAAAAAPNCELQIPFGGAVLRLQQQRLAVLALGVRKARVAVRAVLPGLPQEEQTEVVQGAKPDIRVERSRSVG